MFTTARSLLFGGLAGKLLGAVRELLTAALFGTGPIAVAYRLAQAAFLIPLHGFLSEAFTSGFTPAYARLRETDERRARALFAGMQAAALGVSIVAAILLAWLAGAWIDLLAPGLEPATAATASRMVTLLAVAMPFYALTCLYAAAEIATGSGRMAAARPSAQNLGLIAGAIVAWWRAEPMWIAAGFLAAYLALAAWGFADIASRGVGLRLRRAELAAAGDAMRGVWRAVRVLLLVPVLLQIHLIIERRVASIVSDAAVAALDYARFLADTSVLLLAMPLGIAGLGVMASLELKPFRDLAQRSLRLLLYVGMPLSLVLALHAEPLVRAIFGRGAFGAESIATTSVILSWLAPGLWARLLGYAGAKFLSARGRNVCVIGIHALAVSANVAVNVLLYPTLGAGALGLGAAVSGIVFGLGVVLALGLFGRLLPDLATLGGLAAAYVALWLLAPAVIAAAGWLTLTLFVGYWTAAAALVPRCRHVVLDAWLSFRTA